MYLVLNRFTVLVMGGGLAATLGVYMGINFHHYIVDALIWKRRSVRLKPDTTANGCCRGVARRMSQRTVGGVHWAELDGLRALAILLVMARHSLRPFIAPGCLHTGSHHRFVRPDAVASERMDRRRSVFRAQRLSDRPSGVAHATASTRFWFKRVTRILPAYWTCLAIVAIILTATGRGQRSGGDFLAHVVMLQDYTGSVFVPAFWSLGRGREVLSAGAAVRLLVARCRQPRSQVLRARLAVGVADLLRGMAAASVDGSGVVRRLLQPLPQPVSPHLRIARPRLHDRLAVAAMPARCRCFSAAAPASCCSGAARRRCCGGSCRQTFSAASTDRPSSWLRR